MEQLIVAAIVGAGVLVWLVTGWLYRHWRGIARTTDAVVIGSLAAAVRAKRKLSGGAAHLAERVKDRADGGKDA